MARRKDKYAALRGMVDAILEFAATIERKRAEGLVWNRRLGRWVRKGGRRPVEATR